MTDVFDHIHVTDSGCWEWARSRKSTGYGVTYRNGRQILAHRLAYETAVGPIPDGMFVCHHCDNPPCINPAHLFLGNHRDNVRDCIAKGRFRGGGIPGQKHVAKLTLHQREQIVLLYQAGMGVKPIARKFNTHPSNVRYHLKQAGAHDAS